MVADRHLSPADAVVALRSFGRRFGAVVAEPDDAPDDVPFDPDVVGRHVGPAGRSALDHLGAADAVAQRLVTALAEVSRGNAPGIESAEFTALGPDATMREASAAQVVERVAASMGVAADAVDAVASSRWDEAATTLVQDGVGVIADHLRSAQAVVTSLR